MKKKVIYRVWVNYVDTIGRSRFFGREFTDLAFADKYYDDKYKKYKKSCCRSEFYLFKISQISSSTCSYIDILRESFVG